MSPVEIVIALGLVALAFSVGQNVPYVVDRFGRNFVTLILVLMAVFAVLTVVFHSPTSAIAVLLVVGFALAWFNEFRFLMLLDDEAFPGRYDKPIWALLLIALPPVGALTFHSFRKAHWPEPKPVDAGVARDLS